MDVAVLLLLLLAQIYLDRKRFIISRGGKNRAGVVCARVREEGSIVMKSHAAADAKRVHSGLLQSGLGFGD